MAVSSIPAAVNVSSGSYSRTVKTRSNMSRKPKRSPNVSRPRPPACTQSSGRLVDRDARRAVHGPPDPRHEVAPVIEVEVRDGDCIDVRPASRSLRRPSTPGPQSTRSRPPSVLHQVARMGAARVGPRRGGADDREFHGHILPPWSRKIRVVIAKPGLDGHDRGAKIIARALRDAGMEVIYTGLHQTPEQIVETAIQEDADAVGISILSGAHMTLVPRIIAGLRENDADDVLVLVGGTIPDDDADELEGAGWLRSSRRARRQARSSTSSAARSPFRSPALAPAPRPRSRHRAIPDHVVDDEGAGSGGGHVERRLRGPGEHGQRLGRAHVRRRRVGDTSGPRPTGRAARPGAPELHRARGDPSPRRRRARPART